MTSIFLFQLKQKDLQGSSFELSDPLSEKSKKKERKKNDNRKLFVLCKMMWICETSGRFTYLINRKLSGERVSKATDNCPH